MSRASVLHRVGCPTMALVVAFSSVHESRAADIRLIEDPVSVRGGLVVCVDPIAARIGAAILADGGNAIDAAVAASFALAVTFPEAGNIGGGGFLVAWMQRADDCFTVDYRETAPALARPDMFLDGKGHVDKSKSEIGWLVVGVPGSPMGLWTAHRRAGRLDWRRLVAPAVQLAFDGFVVDAALAKDLTAQRHAFARMGEPARVYFANGAPPAAGERLKLPQLAASLTRIMKSGPDGFYRGETANLIDRAMRQNGGLVRCEDLAAYRAVVRAPVRGGYRGHEIVSIGPPSGGGVALIEMLNILEGLPLRELGDRSPVSAHYLVEAMKRAYYDRAKFLGDPDFVSLPVTRLLSKRHAASWRSTIGVDATVSASFGNDILTPENDATTHLSVIDGDGNAVAVTTTLEGSFGAKVIAPGTGFLLNNEMHDFNVWPGHTTTRGDVGTAANLIAPGKRMLSSQTPTLVLKDRKPLLVLGSPGGRTITNTVLQVIVNVIDHRMPIQQAVNAPRLHHQWQPDEVRIEPGFAVEIADGLRQRRHVIRTAKEKQGDCHAIYIDPMTGLRTPGVDRRRRGAAVGF